MPEWLKSTDFWRGAESVAIMLAAIVAGISFWYKDIHLARRLPAGLVVTPELEEIARWNDTALVRARIKLTNQSPSKVFVPALYYRAWGVDLRSRRQGDPALLISRRDSMPEAYARFAAVDHEDVIASRRLLPRHDAWFQPGAESQFEEYIVVPVCDYKLVRLQVDYFFSKNVNRITRVTWTQRDSALEPSYYLKTRLEGERPLSNGIYGHRSWKRRYGAGSNWTYAILPLRRDAAGKEGRGGTCSRPAPRSTPTDG